MTHYFQFAERSSDDEEFNTKNMIIIIIACLITSTISIRVNVTPNDGSFIASSSKSSDLVISLSIFEIPACLQHTSSADLNLNLRLHVFANDDHIDQTPTLSMQIPNVCRHNIASFTLKNMHYGTQSLIFHLAVDDRVPENILWSGLVWYSVVPSSLRETLHETRVMVRDVAAVVHHPLVPTAARLPRVMIVGTGNMDGQKIIWLEQMRLLQQHIDFFYVCYVCSSTKEWTFLKLIDKLHIPILQYPGFDVDATLGSATNFPHNVLSLISRNTIDHRALNVEELRFVNDFQTIFVSPLLDKDVLVFANSQSPNDLFLQKAAQIARVAVVLDLPNLHPTPGLFDIDVIVAPSEFALNQCRKVFEEDTQIDFQVISPGVDVSVFHPRSPSPSHQPNLKLQDVIVYRIGFVGRLTSEKSPGLFLRTARILELYKKKKTSSYDIQQQPLEFEFVVVGDGPLRKAMEIISQRLGIESDITYVGWLDRTSIASMLQTLDVLINPSLRESETFCIANIEAMASGVPIVTFGAHGVGEYLNADTNETSGLVVGHNVPRLQWCRELAMLTLKLLYDRSFHQEIAFRARNVVLKTFSSKKMVEKYVHVYRTLTHSNLWKRRSASISFQKVIMEMSKSEVNKLLLDVKSAQHEIVSIVHDSSTNDAFATVIRSAILGITRFPLIVHMPNAS